MDAAAQPDDAVSSANASPEMMQDSMPEPGAQADGHLAESSPAPMAQPHAGIEGQPVQEQAPQPAHAQAAEHNANPSLAELEDELFPLPEEEKEHVSQSSSSVFVSGGFLPGSGNGQPG